jgi:hypothetical protein
VHVPGAPVAVAVCIAVAAGLAAYYAVRATAWAVMTDELQVARLATSIAETLSPVPYVHGVYYGALSQLYPLLLAPLYGTLSAPAAQTAAHALNGLLLAGAAWPAYLLGRSVGGSRAAGLVAAALTAFTPWLALSSTLLTENAAYPAFVSAVFLCHRAIAAPSAGRDLGALAGLVLAFFARTQLFVLALALPVAVVLHEVVWARREKGGLRAAAGRHRVLVGAYAGGAAGAGRLVLAGALGNVVGNYATPFHGELLPAGFWGAVAAHLVQVVVGSGVLPFALAASWAATSLIRPHSRSGHAFAALFAVLVPLLTFEVTSFDLRFTPNRFIQDRYLVYLVPLFAVGASAWLAQRTDWKLRVASLALVGAGLVALLGWIKLDDPIIFWAAPGAAVQPALAAAADHAGCPRSSSCGWRRSQRSSPSQPRPGDSRAPHSRAPPPRSPRSGSSRPGTSSTATRIR